MNEGFKSAISRIIFCAPSRGVPAFGGNNSHDTVTFLDFNISVIFISTFPILLYIVHPAVIAVFIGFDNYVRLFNDSQVWQALWNTIQYAVIIVPISIALSLILAALLNKKIRGRTFYRTLFFMPMVVAPAAIAMVWRWMFNTQFGLLNYLLGTNIYWISNPELAIFSLSAIGIWGVLGYNMVLFLAALQDVPKDFYEAARIDGANAFHQFFKITLPMISPMIFFVAVTRMIATFQLFDLIFMVISVTNPALQRTQTLVYLFYRHAFMENNLGYGSAIVVLLLVVILLVTVGQILAQKKWVHYG